MPNAIVYLGGDVGALQPANLPNTPGSPTGNPCLTPLLFSPDNAFDIGASGANRPRNLYLAGFALIASKLTAWGGVQPGNSANQTGSGTLYSCSGVPAITANDGDICFRTDTPAVANQRIYVRSAGAWVGIV